MAGGTRAAGNRLRPLLLVLVALLAACSSTDDAAQHTSSASITTAIARTARYFDTRPPRGDVGFLIGQASLRLSPAFVRWSDAMRPDPQVTKAMADPSALPYLEALLWQGRGRQHRPWRTLPVPALPPVSKPSTLSDDELTNVTKVMGMALKCEQLDAAQRQQWLALLATPSHSYLLTHQLLSLVWGRNAGCLTDVEADPMRTTLATALDGELRADGDKVNDLSLERMAMLCYADLCNWVSRRQTNAVLAAQHSDGSWGDGSVPINRNAFVPPDHTAGLGFYVLAMKWDPKTPPPRPPRSK
jgi:hypothetical protein